MTAEIQSWQVLFDSQAAALVLFSRQWAVCHADAEDIVQEAFVRFWRSQDRANDPTAYLYACVRTAALDFLKRQQRQDRRVRAAGREAENKKAVFESAGEDNDEMQAAELALAELPEGQRQVLVMKIWGGLTFPQIGKAMDIPNNTAASRYRYAIASLRKQLVLETER